ncbi:MAG: sulfate ABC transporter substrate-binding protein [Desulfovibrio sp.]|jgi:sulfate transport system substrate-binding protein|nr:sulfate ABC transporter substrate-binding protein [Desulfovibrio sp.]
MKKDKGFISRVTGAVLVAAFLLLGNLTASAAEPGTLLNASYDVAREFYKQYNPLFEQHWKKKTGQSVTVTQAHGGSSTQAKAVADGLEADVVTMNTSSDIDFLARAGVVSADWAKEFPDNAAPTTSTMLFLVRKGNPKNIRDWNDLIRPDIKIVVVNPKTGGNGRYAYLAAWGQILHKGGSPEQAQEFIKKFYVNVPVLASGGRAATTTFLQQNVGDVLITFESEVVSVERDFGQGKVEAVYPSVSIIAENPVAIVKRTVDKKGSYDLAHEYLQYLYSEEAQEIAANNALRPRSARVLAKHADFFKPIALFSVQQYFGSLSEAQKTHFTDGAIFDQLYTKR